VAGFADAGGEDFTLGIPQRENGSLEIRCDAYRRDGGSLSGQDFRHALLDVEGRQSYLV
jgi:hypothetical protein